PNRSAGGLGQDNLERVRWDSQDPRRIVGGLAHARFRERGQRRAGSYFGRSKTYWSSNYSIDLCDVETSPCRLIVARKPASTGRCEAWPSSSPPPCRVCFCLLRVL